MINNKNLYLKKYTRGENKLLNDDPSLYLTILKHNEVFKDITWSNKLYNFIFNITIPPTCINCDQKVNYQRFNLGYSKFCSNICHLKSEQTKELRKKTNIRKYGVENSFQSILVKNKIKKTNIMKYGVENPMQSKQIKYKVKQTNIAKFGIENYSQTKEFRTKSKDSFYKKYGVDSPSKNSDIKIKIKYSKEYTYIKKWTKILGISINDINILDENNIEVKNYCNKHNSFKISKFNLINRINRGANICTECYPISENSSIKEIELRKFIEEELNLTTEKKYIDNKEIDVFIATHNLGIEFDGLYWHSSIFKNNNYHLNKTELCEKNKIQLLHVFEDEWINKKEIVKSIIKSKLGLIENKIFARKCFIKEIESKLSKEFLDNNHIQSNVNSSIKLGLFYNNELVTVMTFGKKRIAMGNKTSIEGEYEMLRFCNKLNISVIGGASKLFKYFIINYKPLSILSYADRRYSQGNLYKQLGFKYIGNSKPSYFYFKQHELKRLYRFNFRKNLLVEQGFDVQKTEHQIMNERGYYRIYDCGTLKFKFTVPQSQFFI